MVQPSLSTEFNCQVLQWDGITAPMKEPIGILGKTYLTSRKMRKVIMKTAEKFFTREATERLVRILVSTNAKADL